VVGAGPADGDVTLDPPDSFVPRGDVPIAPVLLGTFLEVLLLPFASDETLPLPHGETAARPVGEPPEEGLERTPGSLPDGRLAPLGVVCAPAKAG
jgi:hypothetical protein